MSSVEDLGDSSVVISGPAQSELEDCISALVVLGYPASEANKAARSAYEDGLSVDELIEAMKAVVKNKIELFGSTYYVITPKEDVKAENLTKQVETVESEACNFMLEKKEYHHTGSGEEPEPQRIKGDVNGDGKVDVNDATLVQQYAAELIPFTDAQLRAGDTNGDGKVDINDATRIQQFAAELIPSFDA